MSTEAMNRSRLLLVCFALTATAVFATSVSAAAGDLDPTFDADGKVVTDVGSVDDRAYDLAIQRDGKIVVFGEAYTGALNFVLARHNRNGSLDASFGAGGIVRTEFGWGRGVAIQPDGKIVAVGGGALPGGTSLDFAVARYNADGTLDPTFGAGGKAVADFGFSDIAFAVAIQRDGKIVAAGHARRTRVIGTEAFAVARFNSEGSLDASFDGDGRVTTPFSSLSDAAFALEIQRDGKLVVSGYAGHERGGEPSPTGAVARYNPDGSPDASFDGDGRLMVAETSGSRLALQADGRILVGGGTIVRLNADGSRDPSFGRSGLVTLDCMWSGPLLVQSDKKIVVTGTTMNNADFTVLRLHPDGRVDSGFRGGKCAATDFGSASLDVPAAAALQPDGRIVVAGWTQLSQSHGQDFAVARYLNPAPPTCNVPNVVKKTLRAARVALAKARCRVGKVMRKYSQRVNQGRVSSQKPRAGSTLPSGAKVNLVVSRGRRR
jgi:uncharacterized delta-60 repeat protein